MRQSSGIRGFRRALRGLLGVNRLNNGFVERVVQVAAQLRREEPELGAFNVTRRDWSLSGHNFLAVQAVLEEMREKAHAREEKKHLEPSDGVEAVLVERVRPRNLMRVRDARETLRHIGPRLHERRLDLGRAQKARSMALWTADTADEREIATA